MHLRAAVPAAHQAGALEHQMEGSTISCSRARDWLLPGVAVWTAEKAEEG
jgi:hypothetical protein